MENAVLFEINNGVATITLNRPDRYNAVNQDLVDGISNSLKKCEADQSIRAVVITGAGRGFALGQTCLFLEMRLLLINEVNIL